MTSSLLEMRFSLGLQRKIFWEHGPWQRIKGAQDSGKESFGKSTAFGESFFGQSTIFGELISNPPCLYLPLIFAEILKRCFYRRKSQKINEKN